jgi:hypothetical protein
MDFSRKWNIPVHHFLRRHVYGASRPYVSRNMATFITFLVSALGHELVMSCITKKLRGYGFFAQMLQLPIISIQKTNFVRGKPLFNVSLTNLASKFELMGCGQANQDAEYLFLDLAHFWTFGGEGPTLNISSLGTDKLIMRIDVLVIRPCLAKEIISISASYLCL